VLHKSLAASDLATPQLPATCRRGICKSLLFNDLQHTGYTPQLASTWGVVFRPVGRGVSPSGGWFLRVTSGGRASLTKSGVVLRSLT
jgi:hypothetical protein